MPRTVEIDPAVISKRRRLRGVWLALIAAVGLIVMIAAIATTIGKVNSELNGRPMHASLTLWRYCIDYSECMLDPRSGERQCTDSHRCEDPGKFTCDGESAHYHAGRAFYILTIISCVPLFVLGLLDSRRQLPDLVAGRVGLRKVLAVVAFIPAVFSFLSFVIGIAAWHRDHCMPSISDQAGASVGPSPFLCLLACVAFTCGGIIALVYRTRVEVAEMARIQQLQAMPKSHPDAPVVVTSHPHRGKATFATENHAAEPLNNEEHDAINVEIARSLYTEDTHQASQSLPPSGIRVGRSQSHQFEI